MRRNAAVRDGGEKADDIGIQERVKRLNSRACFSVAYRCSGRWNGDAAIDMLPQ